MTITKNIIAKMILIIIIFALQLKADGFIVIPQPGHSPFPLEVVYHKVKVDIYNNIATTNIEQEFYNPSIRRMEGYYIFPVPVGAVINDFKMEINGQMMQAELLDAKKARELYEDIVRKMKDPALLEYNDQQLFKLRIFPIEPQSKKNVTISYTEVLSQDYDFFSYVYPLNTEKFSAAPLKNISITTTIESDKPINTVYVPTHETDIIRKNTKRVIVSYEDENIKPDSDFKLYYNLSSSSINMSILPYREKGNDGYFLLNITPSLDFNKSDIQTKNITFVLDKSGSMQGEKLTHAKNALNYCLENLNSDDRFEIIAFSTEVKSLFNNLVEPNKNNIGEARKFISDLKSVGGTNIEEALQVALSTEHKNNRPHIIVFITDGKPTIGETNENGLLKSVEAKNNSSTKIFTFGIGTEINTHLLDKITELTNASRTYMNPNEDIELKISGFYDKIQYPVLTDLKIDVSGNVEFEKVLPKSIPDLFKGTDITVLGRYENYGIAKVKLTGKLGGKTRTFETTFDFPDRDKTHAFIPQLWAARRIGWLLDQIRLNGEDKELVDEIVDLARKYGIITPYTSYLILEDETTRTASNRLPREFQTIDGIIARGDNDRTILKEEYDSFSLSEGKKSIQNSEELQVLSNVKKLPQTAVGQTRVNFSSPLKENNLVQQRQGRAFYLNSNIWIDSDLQLQNNNKTKKIKFGSDEYFKLAQQKNMNDYLSLGRNVKFIYNNTVYEIFD